MQNQSIAIAKVVERRDQIRAKQAALSAIPFAIANLQAVADDPQTPVTTSDDWATLGDAGGETYVLGNTSFRLQIVDASAFINLNTASEAVLLNMDLTQEQIDSLLDWRETNADERAEGATDQYYNSLATPYNARLGRLQSVSELCLIQGFTPAEVYLPLGSGNNSSGNTGLRESALADIVTADSYSPSTQSDGNAKLNLNGQNLSAQNMANNLQIPVQVAQQVLLSRNARPNRQFGLLSEALSVPAVQANNQYVRNLLDRATVRTGTRLEGMINANTAPEEVLSMIPGITPELAATLVSNRGSTAFTNLSDLLNSDATPTFVNAVADNLCVNSQSFVAQIEGIAGSTRVYLLAYLEITDGVAKLIRIEHPPYTDATSHWLWQSPTSEVELISN
jgi:general secretion pathway protein K